MAAVDVPQKPTVEICPTWLVRFSADASKAFHERLLTQEVSHLVESGPGEDAAEADDIASAWRFVPFTTVPVTPATDPGAWSTYAHSLGKQVAEAVAKRVHAHGKRMYIVTFYSVMKVGQSHAIDGLYLIYKVFLRFDLPT